MSTAREWRSCPYCGNRLLYCCETVGDDRERWICAGRFGCRGTWTVVGRAARATGTVVPLRVIGADRTA